ncbi:MAG TPA: FHA domain-containing protein [Aggregatilineales bacterium]|nr:FHA domain-containing protein [Aggregatilineales bacterium]
MICRYCGKENVSTAVFCIRCQRLLAVRDLVSLPKTAIWGHAPLPPAPVEPPPPRRHVAHLGRMGNGNVGLYLGDKSDFLCIEVRDRCVLGRVVDGTTNAIDLSRYSALEKGVSRNHCALSWQGDVLTVEDLNSSNGTWYNSVRLAPFHPHTIQNGELLLLGKLDVWVYYR